MKYLETKYLFFQTKASWHVSREDSRVGKL